MPKNEKGQVTNDLHINSNGRSRLLSIGKFLPKGWGWVRVTKTKSTDDTVWLQIKRLNLVEGTALAPGADSNGAEPTQNG